MVDMALTQANFLNLGTYRKSGQVVNTPVWFAELEGLYYVFSASDAGKVKRLKNSSRATVAACTATGKLTGEWIDASAWLIEDQNKQMALRALHKKYGWQMAITDCLSKLTGKYSQRAYIAIQINSSD